MAGKIERIGVRLIQIAVLGLPCACLAGVFLITLGTDEAWILFRIRGLVEHGGYGAGTHLLPDYTTAGLFTLAASFLHWVGNGEVGVIRILSVACVGGVALTLFLWSGQLSGRTAGRWIAASSILAVPGTMVLGAQAYGTIMATALVLLGMMLWGRFPAGTWERRAWVGAVLGAAAATRMNCVVALLAPVGAAMFCSGRRRAEFQDAAFVLGIGGAIFWGGFEVLKVLTPEVGAGGLATASSGFVSPLDIPFAYFLPKRLLFWIVGRSYLAFFVMVLISCGWIFARARVSDPRGPDALLVFAWILWGAWVAHAPVPHLRYLWPALACFAFLGALELGIVYGWAAEHGRPEIRAGAIVLALSFAVCGYVQGTRDYLNGSGDVLSWEWNGRSRMSLQHGPFRYLKSERAIVKRLKEIPAEESIATLGFDTALAYRTRRPIRPIRLFYGEDMPGRCVGEKVPRSQFPRWLVVTPIVNRFPNSYISPPLHRWMEGNCRLSNRYGPYLLYRVTGTFPTTAGVFVLDRWNPRYPLSDNP